MIRKARVEDVPRIVEMVGHFITGTRYHAFLRFVPKAIEQLTTQILEHGIILVDERDDVVVGLIAALPMEEPISRQTQLDELVWWVEPEYRRSTVGPRLLRALEAWGRQKGVKLCRMVAPIASDVGAYYVRVGYTAVETSYLKRL